MYIYLALSHTTTTTTTIGGLPLPAKAGHRRDHEPASDWLHVWWFGVVYGTSSASCSAPVFIALLGMALQETLFEAASVFAAYSLSVAACIVLFTVTGEWLREIDDF
jgi:cytochrome c biogenesis protein CcdA